MTNAQPSLFIPFEFFPAERRVFAKRDKLKPSEWAERHRVVPIGAHKGYWRNHISPHLVKIMDVFALPHIREIVICKSPQTGGTEVMFNCAAYLMDYSPAEMMFVMPSEAQARKITADRIIPMILESPQLLSLVSPNPDDMAKMRIKLNNGTIIYMAWANSATALASTPIKYIFFDETDKYPPFVGKETDPITLGEKRVTTFRYTHKMFKVSTPTREDGPIWKAYQSADVQYKYHVSCPDCGREHIMSIDGLRYNEDKTAEDIRRDGSAHYECPHCHALWDDIAKQKAVRAGRWRREKGKGILRPRSAAFHLPSWISPDISLGEIAAAYINAKTDRAKLIDFYNAYLAEPYVEIHIDRKEDQILALRDDRPRGLVPADISCLTAAVDTQARGFYYEVRAWGYGYSLDSWQVREGFVETFDGLKKILIDDIYLDAEGNEHKIALSLIDSGGGLGDYGVSRTAEVYDFCRRVRSVIPIKGQQRMSQPFKSTVLDHYPGTNKPIPGGLRLYNINTTYYKDYLASKLAIAPADPGAWRLHSETTAEYARQMTAEYKDEKGFWQCQRNRANHYWDIAVYNLACADILGVKYIPNPKEGNKNEPQQQNQKTKPVRNRRW